MNELVKNAVEMKDGKAVTTSLKLAEVFGKRHDYVLRTIKELDVPPEFSAPNLGGSSTEQKMPNGGTKQIPMYTITRDGFILLAMGFTGAKVMQFKLAYIEAFNAMERKLKSGRGRVSSGKLEEIADRPERMTFRGQRLPRLTDLSAFYAVPENNGEATDYCPSCKIRDKNYCDFHVVSFINSDGKKVTRVHLKWTEVGRRAVIELWNKRCNGEKRV